MADVIATLTDEQYVQCMVFAGWVEAQEENIDLVYVTSIKIEWSESHLFASGQIIDTVKEFETTIRMGASQIGYHNGYDKTKYAVTWSNGEISTHRTDIGDDYTHNYSFYAERKAYRTHLLANPDRMKAYGEDEQTLIDTLASLEISEKHQLQIES